MGRISILDGLRGWCLVFMMVTHLHINGDFLLGYAHFNQLTFADSAQAFIFLSGLLVGLVGVKQYRRQGISPMTRRYWGRALELYGWHLGLLVTVMTLVWLVPASWFAWRDWLQHLLVAGDAYAGATAALLYQPTYLDILPQYILYLLAAPLAIYMVAHGKSGYVLAGSIGLWLGVQLGLDAPLATWLQEAIRLSGQHVTFRAAFNPLGWQLLFVTGLVIGGMLVRGEIDTNRLLTPRHGLLLQLVLGLLALSIVLRLALPYLIAADPEWAARLRPFEDRQALALLRVSSFTGLAFVLAWVLVVAPTSRQPWLQIVGTNAHRLLGHPWFSMLGRHSLPVFVFHVVLIYLLKLADTHLGGIADPWYSLLALVAIVSLGAPAALLDARRRLAASPAGKAC